MEKGKIIITLLIGLFLVAACSKPKIIRELPAGNLTKISPKESPNTKSDEVAPVQQPTNISIVDPCLKEGEVIKNAPFDGIITSAEFIRRTFPLTEYNKEAIDYLTSNVESVTFLTINQGYAAFSHPPTTRYIQRYQLPMSGSVGGTDIFSFSLKDGGVFFEVLPQPINSEFWDSHPFVTNDVLGNQLLIWASDRIDNQGGFSFPYQNEGNTDLYYAFKKPYENWDEVKIHNFNDVLADINTKYSEASPFLFCKCYNPTLLFASNRDSKDSTFDIFYVNLEIDFINQKITAKGPVKKFETGEQTINTSADERFPYIPYPHISTYDGDLNIYFTSNRNKDSIVFVTKDSAKRETRIIFKNVGGYDLYRFQIKRGKDFSCAPPPPPPPPKLTLVVRINEFCYNFDGSVIDSALNVDGVCLLNSRQCNAKVSYELEFGKKYRLEVADVITGCGGICDSCFSQVIEFVSPTKILKDTTLEFTLNKYCIKRAPRLISFSMKKGLAFFVTGYWYPTTMDNLQELWRRSASGCLSLSNFIDSTDFRPDEKYFYVTAAEVNDRWLNETFYPTIDSLLQLLDTCYNNQKLVITVHGYTDPCPLRTVRDQAGRIIQDSTRFTCDESFVFERNDVKVVVPQGVLMKFPNLKTTEGKAFTPPIGTQQGNYVLAMLRAYFTQQTLKNGFKKKYAQFPEKLRRFDQFVAFTLNAFGIYDERPPCPEIDKDIVGVELANKPYPPTLNEPCNLPHSRRVMIYVDVVSSSMVEKKTFAREECGKISYVTYLEKKKEKKPEVVQPPISEEELTEDLGAIEIYEEQELEKPQVKTCPGRTYKVVFCEARNTDEYEFLKGFIISLGFEVEDGVAETDGNQKYKLPIESKEIFCSPQEANELILTFNERLKKISPLINFRREQVRAYVKAF